MSYQAVGSRAMVTGASSGIGAAFAHRLGSAGAQLVLVGRDADTLGTVAPDAPGGVEALVADLGTTAGAGAVADRLRSPEKPVDLLVHAAGSTTARPFGIASLDDELEQLQLNVLATTHLLHAAVTAMQGRGGGAIVLVGSTAAHWSAGSYAATKAWLEVLAGGLTARSAETGVHVLVTRPGFTRTRLHDRAGVDNSG